MPWLVLAANASAQTPIDDPLGGPPYLGMYELGAYPDGANEMPPEHYAAGLAFANAVVPLDTDGNPDPVNGQIVLLSVGMSNTAAPWCNLNGEIPVKLDPDGSIPCLAWTLMGRMRHAGASAAIHPNMHPVAGAFPAEPAVFWVDDTSGPIRSNPPNPDVPDIYGTYTRLRDYFFPYETPPITEAQVQVVWLKQLNPMPTTSLPAADADAYVLEERLGQIVRFMKSRYPNLKIVFLTNSGYRGNNTNGFHPEPEGYECGLSVKWLIEAQIQQVESGGARIDEVAGDLNYQNGVAPWLAWGPNIWANGPTARNSDGLSWVPEEFVEDGVHLVPTGASKFGLMLHHFFTFSPFAHCWFVGDGPCE